MEKKIIYFSLLIFFLLSACSKKILQSDNLRFDKIYHSKTDIIKDCIKYDDYIIDTLSINFNVNKNLFVVLEDFGSGERIVEMNIFVESGSLWMNSMKIKKLHTTKIKYKIDKEYNKLILYSKSNYELISIPLTSIIFSNNEVDYDY